MVLLEIPPFSRNDSPQDGGNGGSVGGAAAHTSTSLFSLRTTVISTEGRNRKGCVLF